ncbi:type 1 glutamine amidotransferase domain-containing protein [Parvularcula maris]|uniref:Type 1 glutamine amidotransferase n=1 Tax=Parvularcula maris TaxID=2965077 RepID=A0A9X2LBD5_9PROT|nr:type 1 glutamine amidotransferase domain-containing protein [Parvularcula maris]MCQ8186567.1 type 1 glutamine amidotransferase [Parvularcula maris]
MPQIQDAKILIMATDGFEQSELLTPRDQLSGKGATVHVASPDGEDIRGWDEKDWGETVHADKAISAQDADNYDALVLPGGQINPDKLRLNKEALDLIQRFNQQGKPIAAICHAPWLLAETGIAKGRTLTAYDSIRTDLRNAGATVVDQEVVRDENIITSRNPGDLDAFVGEIADAVAGS